MLSKTSEIVGKQKSLSFDWRKYMVYIAFAVVFVFFAATLYDDGFLTTNNLLNIIRQTAIISIMAVAMTFVIGAAQIDLSVGSIAALASLTCALAMESGFGLLGGIVAGLGTGVVIGLINGLLISRLAIPSFLVTLGTMIIVSGAAMWITNTAPVPIRDTTFTFIFGSGNIGPVPILLVWMLVIAVIGHYLLRKTGYGRRTLATGGNENAARFSGINVSNIKLWVMVGSGTMAALAGMLYAGRMSSGRYTFGEGDEMSVIAAVILGGTSLFGGTATVVGTVIGALMIGMINNGLIIMGLDVSQQNVVKGLIIILAVAFGKKALKR
ncbi:ABC transporter permease [Paenibacillus cisolokensis]|uniref:ABC transporter permease n=1 Tax=Paenibacillus cisolokensis TaxID=1658519 RepID=A0ABQ4ND92_9BACL|nr:MULTISPECIES: ABC transporter permease [Paenibacillus]ALS28629.1 ABC transporter permease [Paenibacillus sp. 32O-W]GIQ66207.1 ABC transporter permease [Paenibacillus cisolokensis]